MFHICQAPHDVSQFFYFLQLKTHIRCHSGVKPYKCSVCERSFPHNNTLKSHLRRHYDDRQYGCEFCPKKFIDRTALVRHLRTHTGMLKIFKNFKFDLCSAYYFIKIIFLFISGEKPYFCDLCNKEFATATNLNKHRKVINFRAYYYC